MDETWRELAQVAGAHLLAVVSPGPDFAMVLKQSLTHGRRTGIWTSVGVGAGILLHVTYSLLGLGLLLRGSELWFNGAKYLGAAYLAWIGVQALRIKPREGDGGMESVASAAPPPARAAFFTGFLTNALNPKVALVFFSLYAVVVSPRTPKLIQAAYGGWMAITTAVWFCLVAVLFTQAPVRRTFLRHGHWIDRALGVVFLVFSVSLVVARVR